MLLHLICQMCIIVAICVLWRKSVVEFGFADVTDYEFSASFDATGFHPAKALGSSFWWTTVPSWILGIYTAFWSAMLDELQECHTTLELHKSELKPLPWSNYLTRIFGRKSSTKLEKENPDVSTTRKTLLLEYGHFPFVNAITAFRYGHTLLGLCMLLRAAFWGAGGAAASMFSVASVPFESSTRLVVDKVFDQYASVPYGQGQTLRSSALAFDIVSATIVNDGAPYPWTTPQYSFLPFRTREADASGTYTAHTDAYFSTLENCMTATQDDLVRDNALQIKRLTGDADGYAMLSVSFTQQGCYVTKPVLISALVQQYLISWSETTCANSTRNRSTRMGLISGIYNATAPYLTSNLQLISCTPNIYHYNVSATVSFSSSSNKTASNLAQVLAVREESHDAIWPSFARRWIGDIPIYATKDPTSLMSLDNFSKLVLFHTRKGTNISTTDIAAPDPETLLASFQTIYQAFFANWAQQSVYYPSGANDTIEGTLTRVRTRLFVVAGAAAAVLSIAILGFLTSLVLALYLFLNRGTLKKHLKLLLGHALLIHNSRDVDSYIQALEKAAGQEPGSADDVDLVEYAKQQKDLGRWTCEMNRREIMLIGRPQTSPGGDPLPPPVSSPATVISSRVNQGSEGNEGGIELQPRRGGQVGNAHVPT